jgi:hypothetical protein
MAAPVHPTINDQMTKVQLRLLKQRLEQDREQTNTFVNQGRHSQPIIDEKYNHLKEAAFQRKELLDRLKHEQQLSRQLLRPRSNPVDDVAPRQRPNRRTESQPQLTDSRRHGEMNYYPVRLQPIEHAPLPSLPSLPPPVLPPVPAYPLPVSTYQVMQPTYQVAPPQIVNQQQQPASNSRSDMYEMMMMQNAQMHQMIMQQLMLNSIQPRLNQNSTNNTNTSSSSNSNDRDKVLALDLDDIRKLLKTSRENRRPPVYPDYRYNSPYGGYPPLVPTYHRPLEPIPV